MTCWDYRAESFADSDLDYQVRFAKKLGSEGWRMTLGYRTGAGVTVLWFEREIVDKIPAIQSGPPESPYPAQIKTMQEVGLHIRRRL